MSEWVRDGRDPRPGVQGRGPRFPRGPLFNAQERLLLVAPGWIPSGLLLRRRHLARRRAGLAALGAGGAADRNAPHHLEGRGGPEVGVAAIAQWAAGQPSRRFLLPRRQIVLLCVITCHDHNLLSAVFSMPCYPPVRGSKHCCGNSALPAPKR